MTELKVLVSDDEGGPLATLESELQGPALQEAGLKVHVVPVPSSMENDESPLHDEVAVLERRRIAWRAGQNHDEETTFDTADVVVVDFDHAHSGDMGSTTGEDLAYLVRSFSSAGTIVVLNQFLRTIDLTMWDPAERTSFADVNVRSDAIGSPAVWRRDAPGLSPWARIPVVDFLVRLQAASAILEPELTWGDLFGDATARAQSLPAEVRDLVGLHDANSSIWESLSCAPMGLLPKDREARFPEAVRRRFLAARLIAWFERSAIAPQSTFVDLPHLVERVFPQHVDALEPQSDWDDLPAELRAVPGRAPGRPWHRTCFWCWPECLGTQGEEGLFWPKLDAAPKVFCEDTSAFLARDQASAFESDVPGPFSTRWVAHADDGDYVPRTRLFL